MKDNQPPGCNWLFQSNSLRKVLLKARRQLIIKTITFQMSIHGFPKTAYGESCKVLFACIANLRPIPFVHFTMTDISFNEFKEKVEKRRNVNSSKEILQLSFLFPIKFIIEVLIKWIKWLLQATQYYKYTLQASILVYLFTYC